MIRLLVSFLLLSIQAVTVAVSGVKDSVVVKKSGYTMVLTKTGFGYSFRTPDGRVIAKAHPESGLRFSEAGRQPLQNVVNTEVISANTDSVRCVVTNQHGGKADVGVYFFGDYVRFSVTPRPNRQPDGRQSSTLKYTIEARTAPLGPAYGLGDHGGYGRSTNVFGLGNNRFLDNENGLRFVSTFSIFPAQGMAQVLFEKGHKRVAINAQENKLGANGVTRINLYYFFGSMETIYQRYALVKEKEGYPAFRPKYDFFEVGYEAFGSLGWNTYQTSVEKDVSTYVEKGYPLKWAVVGSGFWKGERRNPAEGATTSFGIWDSTYQAGRRDNLPNPRYPDVGGMKQFFADRGIHLFLGLRINFKAPTTDGGHYHPDNDGPVTEEGLVNRYFISDAGGKPLGYTVNFPQGNVYLLDGNNPAALRWYGTGVKKWGVRGFKEDTMLKDGEKLADDGKLNRVNEELMRAGYYVMVRNAAYSVPGDILRLEDTRHGLNQDRPVINALNYASSGAPNVYPDIVAGKYLTLPLTEDQKRYFVRNALFAAVCPAMSLGLGPWHLGNGEYERTVKKAVDWHHQFAPYLHSAAVESYETGYPHTMTPLPIAFPRDTATYALADTLRRQYAWMLGPSLLAAPAYGNDYATVQTRDVYLPAGPWMDYETGETFTGPVTLRRYAFPVGKIPVFVGGKGVVVTQEGKPDERWVSIFPVAKPGTTYTYHHRDEPVKSIIRVENEGWNPATLAVTDTGTNERVKVSHAERTRSVRFALTPGHHYRLSGGGSVRK